VTTFSWILIGSCAFDLVACATCLWIAARLATSRGTTRLGIRSFAEFGAIAAFVIVTKTAACGVLGLQLFGLIFLGYLDVSIVAPAVGLLIFLLHHLRIAGFAKVEYSAPVRGMAMLLLMGAPISFYATFVEPFRLQVEQASVHVERLNTRDATIKIAVLADLQFNEVTAHERRAIEMAMAAKPDIILLPGDVFQGTAREFDEREAAIRELLMPLRAPGGVYLVSGDCDNPSQLRRAIRGTQITLIDNRIVHTRVRGNRVAIGGVELAYNSAGARAMIQELAQVGDNAEVAILLAHRPDVALQPGLPENLDLIVAGHTHGGQVQVPFFGPPITFSRVPRSVGAGGLHRLRDQHIYVSRGVGCERIHAPRIRFLCPPEVSILSLTASQRGR